jgi:hypothetical protein
MKIIDKWDESSGAGATYEVNVDHGFVNASQETRSFGADVLSGVSPEDAFRLASALILAAEEAKMHRRWRPACEDYEGETFT